MLMNLAYWYNIGWGLMIISFLISLSAEIYVKHMFSKYDKVRNGRGLTGAMIAQQILNSNGIYNINIQRIGGNLTDYYSNQQKIIALSDSTYNSASIAAAGVAAHECGHALQYAKGYFPIKVRNAIIPITQIGSNLWYFSVILGLIFGNSNLGNLFLDIGIIMFIVICFFQFVTLPVEFNASHRALRVLEGQGILSHEETQGAAKVLTAAALTYVAALATSLLQLLRLLAIRNNRRN